MLKYMKKKKKKYMYRSTPLQYCTVFGSHFENCFQMHYCQEIDIYKYMFKLACRRSPNFNQKKKKKNIVLISVYENEVLGQNMHISVVLQILLLYQYYRE